MCVYMCVYIYGVQRKRVHTFPICQRPYSPEAQQQVNLENPSIKVKLKKKKNYLLRFLPRTKLAFAHTSLFKRLSIRQATNCMEGTLALCCFFQNRPLTCLTVLILTAPETSNTSSHLQLDSTPGLSHTCLLGSRTSSKLKLNNANGNPPGTQ